MGHFLSSWRQFLLDAGETSYPWLAGLERSGQRLHRCNRCRSVGKIAVGDDVERLAFVRLGEVAIAGAVLLNDRLGILFDTCPEDLDQIVAARLTGIPRPIA